MTEQPAYDEHYFRRYYPNVTDRLSAIEAYRADSYIFRPTEVWLAQLDWLVDEVKRLRALVAAPQFQFTLRLGRPAMVIECDCIVCRQGAMGVVKEWEAKEKAEQERHELRQQVADLERERDDAIEWRDSWRKHYEEAQVEMQSLRQRVETLETVLQNFDKNGIRCDLNPTIDLWEPLHIHNLLTRMLKLADIYVRDTARAALAGRPTKGAGNE